MKIAVIGCTHAGTAAIKNAVNIYKDADITVYEKNDNVSFLSCGIALYVGGVIKDVEGLFYSSPTELSNLGANVNMRHEVLEVDTENKEVLVKDLETNKTFKDQ